MKAQLYAAPTIEPITIDELAFHLRIDDDTGIETSSLDSILKTGRSYIENVTRRALLTQTWYYYLDEFPGDDFIKLPFGNLQTVTSIKYKDTDAVETPMTVTTDYLVETNGDQCGRLVLPYGESWPGDSLYPSKPITIIYVCGWTTAALVPYEIKSVCKLLCADLYQNRESQVLTNAGQAYAENKTVQNLLASARLWDEF